MYSKKFYVFLIGSLFSILLLLINFSFVPIDKYSLTKTNIVEVSLENDKDLKILTNNFQFTIDETLPNSYLYLNKLTSYSYESELFRPPTLSYFYLIFSKKIIFKDIIKC